MKKILSLLLLPLLPLVTQCSSSGGTTSSASSLPTLSSPARAKAWGAPETLKNANGYRTTYTNPANSKEKVSIIGSSKLMPFFVYPPRIKGTTVVNGAATSAGQPQLWNKSLIQGTTVKWYQVSFPSGDNGAKFTTLGIELKGQDGRNGQFKIEIEGSKNQVPSRLAELRFAN